MIHRYDKVYGIKIILAFIIFKLTLIIVTLFLVIKIIKLINNIEKHINMLSLRDNSNYCSTSLESSTIVNVN